jgi:hypothetical protein
VELKDMQISLILFLFFESKKKQKEEAKGGGVRVPRLSYFHQKSIYQFTC